MKTRIVHNPLAAYNWADRSDKSESYVFVFDENNLENKTVKFTYPAEDAPELNVNRYTVMELLEELEYVASTTYSYSSSYNHIEEKPHSERISIAKQLAAINKTDDNQAFIASLQKQITNLQERVQQVLKA